MLLVIVIAIVVIGAGAAGFFLSAPRSTQSSSTSSSSAGTSVSNSTSTASPFKITYAVITVGFKGGLFQLNFSDAEGKPIAGVVVVLNTPVQAAMCSGGGAVALGFGNCLPAGGKSYTYSPAAGGTFPANTTFTGFVGGAGPGSATVGQSYPLSIKATYEDGTSSSGTFSILAENG